MAIHYAEKYAPVIDEAFTHLPLTSTLVNHNFDWLGVKTVKVFSLTTKDLVDYNIAGGAARFGTPSDMDDAVQEMLIARDRGFAFTLDKINAESGAGAKQAGAQLNQQIREKIIPEIDKYRVFKALYGVNSANLGSTALNTSANNAYDMFLAGQAALDEASVPRDGRVSLVSPTFYRYLKQDDSFIKSSEIAQDMLIKGQIGVVDGVAIIMAPQSIIGNNYFLIGHPQALVGVEKITDYRGHIDPPGISGTLLEGRVVYDAFMLSAKTKGFYFATKAFTVAAAAGADSTHSVISITADFDLSLAYAAGMKIYYLSQTAAGSTAFAIGEDVASRSGEAAVELSSFTGNTFIATTATTKKIAVGLCRVVGDEAICVATADLVVAKVAGE